MIKASYVSENKGCMKWEIEQVGEKSYNCQGTQLDMGEMTPDKIELCHNTPPPKTFTNRGLHPNRIIKCIHFQL